MSVLGDGLRSLAISVATDVHAGAYSQETGAGLRRRILELAGDADTGYDAGAVLRFLEAVAVEKRAEPTASITITTHAEPVVRERRIRPETAPATRPNRRTERPVHNRVSVQVGSRPSVVSDVAFGPKELPLLEQTLRGLT